MIAYFSQSKYIKVFTTRKLYANASGEKLDLVPDEGDDYPIENYSTSKKRAIDDSNEFSTHNAFNVLFPKLQKPRDGANKDMEAYD